jgi:enoyl-CoA hydratase/carnithine racemase
MIAQPAGDGQQAMTDHGGLVDYQAEGGIVTISLNKPEKLNAFDARLVLALKAALRRFDEDASALVAVLAGNGRAFSTGADVRARQARSREEFERLGGPQEPEANSADLLNRSVKWKPIIASVHGYVLGLALGIAFECDLVVAEAGTKFQITETSRGLGGARYWALAHFSGGGAFATEVALTGRYFSAEEALGAGILSRVAPVGTHLQVARELAAQITVNPPLSVRAAVRTRRWFMDRFEREVAGLNDPAQLYLTDDFNEAVRAHLEKRPPRPFKGS